LGAFPHSDLLDFVVVAWVWPICAEVFMRNAETLDSYGGFGG